MVLNISFTGVEFLYGWWCNSLGLTADAIHMLFDSTAILLSLVASVIAKWEATKTFTYGFGRVETLTGFSNALALILASIHIIWDALERFFNPEKILADDMLVVSILGLLVNIVGIFAFDHGGSVGRKNHDCGHDHSHDHVGYSYDHSHDHFGHTHDHFDHSHDHSCHSHHPRDLHTPQIVKTNYNLRSKVNAQDHGALRNQKSKFDNYSSSSHQMHNITKNPLLHGIFI